MARAERVAVLDLGSTWVTCLLAETAENSRIRIAGIGRKRAEGWHNGAVVNPDKATEAVAEAWQAASDMAGFRMDSVIISVTGENIKYIRAKGSGAVKRPHKGITQADRLKVIEEAQAIALPRDEMILHVIPTQYIVDGQKGVTEPRGMYGMKLDVEVHIVIAPLSVIENIYRVIGQANLRVRAPLLRGMAAVIAATTVEERKMGVAVVNIGANTEVVVYKDGAIRHNQVLSLGGDHITNDISVGLRIPQPAAEQVKIDAGVAMQNRVLTDEPITIQATTGPKQISRRLLASIIEPRVEEILLHVDGAMRKSGLTEALANGIVLTGGTAKLPGIDALAEQVFNLPVRIGVPGDIEVKGDIAADPSYVPAVGLVRFGLGRTDDTSVVIQAKKPSSVSEWLGETLGGMFGGKQK